MVRLQACTAVILSSSVAQGSKSTMQVRVPVFQSVVVCSQDMLVRVCAQSKVRLV
jgi:hypothetical protein